MIKFLKSKDFYLLFGLYFISNLLLLLNADGIYWDDWCAYKQTDSTLFLFFDQIQHGIKGTFFLYLADIGNGVYSFRFFVFISTFIMGILVYLILKNIKELDKSTLFFLTAFFLIAPVNSAKISIAVVPFLFPVLLFYIAFYSLTLYLKQPNFVARVAILGLFLTSFSTNSLLVFYFSIFVYMYYFHFHFSYADIVGKAKFLLTKYWDFWILPFMYFIYKAIYLKPYGQYEGYNAVSVANLPKAFIGMFRNIDNSMVEVITESLYSLTSVWWLLLIFLYIAVKHTKFLGTREDDKIFLIIGTVLFALAVFPYTMAGVGKNAELNSWNSRFQMLTPLGLAFVYYFGIRLVGSVLQLKDKVILALIWLLLFSFVGKNISDQYEEHIDWFYSVSIRENIRENELIRQHTTFIVNNSIRDVLLYKRDLIYYELNGISKSSFGDDKRLLIRYEHYIENIKNLSKIKLHKEYNFSHWKPETPLLITLAHNYQVQSGQDEYLRMIYLNLWGHKQFLKMAKDLTTITVEPLQEGSHE